MEFVSDIVIFHYFTNNLLDFIHLPLIPLRLSRYVNLRLITLVITISSL